MCKRLPDDFCRWCGKLIDRERCGSDSRFYCDRACYWAAIHAGEQSFKGKLRGPWDQITEWAFSDLGIESPKTRRSAHKLRPPCKNCGGNCKALESQFCSYDCCKAWRGSRQCDICNANVPNSGAFGKCYCPLCRENLRRQARRKHKKKYGRNHRQRARHYGVRYVPVDVRAIYERDGWKCQICKRKCRRCFCLSKLTGKPHPRSPTIDHIVSLANGGNHDHSNLQLACFECNSRKGAASKGQLRLAWP